MTAIELRIGYEFSFSTRKNASLYTVNGQPFIITENDIKALEFQWMIGRLVIPCKWKGKCIQIKIDPETEVFKHQPI